MAVPESINQYIAYDRIEKDAKFGKEKLRPEVEVFLTSGNKVDGISVSVPKPKEVISEEVCLKWAKANLTPEEYESLFVKVFDQNIFAQMIAHGRIDADKLPPNYKEVIQQSPRITCKHKDV